MEKLSRRNRLSARSETSILLPGWSATMLDIASPGGNARLCHYLAQEFLHTVFSIIFLKLSARRKVAFQFLWTAKFCASWLGTHWQTKRPKSSVRWQFFIRCFDRGLDPTEVFPQFPLALAVSIWAKTHGWSVVGLRGELNGSSMNSLIFWVWQPTKRDDHR